MASIDTEELLEPISEAAPSGPNLEYDAEFLAFERLSHGKPEQQMGDSIRAAEPPDFELLARQAAALLTRSKDLRIAVQLVRALSHSRGFAGLSEGAAVVHGLLERYFETVHPQLDPDEDNDPTMRITAVAGLCAADIVAALRVRPLVVSRSFGPVTLRDFAVAAGNAAPSVEGTKLDLSSIEAAFQDSDLAAHEESAKVIKSAVAHLAGIEAVFDRETSGRGPELGALVDLLRQAQHAVVSRLDRRIGAADSSGTEATEGGHVGASPGKTGPSGPIRTRDDVVRALDKICDYYVDFEPSSPLPLLLQRAKRLVFKSFLDIIRDMAPDGVSQVENIAGRTEE